MSVFGIHSKLILDNEARAAGVDVAPADKQIARTRLTYNSLGQVTKVIRFTTTSVISETNFTYDATGRLTESWNPISRTKKTILYDANGKFEETITYRVADPDR